MREVHTNVTDHPYGNGWLGVVIEQAEGIAKGNRPLPHQDVVAIGQIEEGEVVSRDLEQSNVTDRVGTHHLRIVLLTIGERHDHLAGITGHVIVGHHVAIVGDQKAGSHTVNLVLLAVLPWPKEPLEEGITKATAKGVPVHLFADLRDRNPDNCWRASLYRARDRRSAATIQIVGHQHLLQARGQQDGSNPSCNVLHGRNRRITQGFSVTGNFARMLSDSDHIPFYDVALPIPRSAPLTYAWEGTELQPGIRVLVPLGSRILTGTVVGRAATDRSQVRPIEEVLDVQPSIPPVVLELTRRVAEYYLCSWGEALDAALISGLTPQSVVYLELTAEGLSADLDAMSRSAPRRAALLDYLVQHPGPQRVSHLQQKLGTTSIAQQVESLVRMGLITAETEIERQRGPRRLRAVQLSSAAANDDEALRATFDDLDRRAPKQSLLLGHLYLQHHRKEPPQPATQLAAQLGVTTSVLEGLVAKGLAEWVEVERSSTQRVTRSSFTTRDERTLTLSAEQQRAVDRITACEDTFTVFLLDGVTGSGKTVVYQRAIERCLNRGRTALMLVPEIALTPQLYDRFVALFGASVGLMHSRMSMQERLDMWNRIQSGEVRLVIGPRSAVFAPLLNVGVIIVDEEHEPSYKQDDPSPRYNGRDVAIMRGQLEKCPVILGSATPSLETYANADDHRYERLVLASRADQAELPAVHIVDLRSARKSGHMHGTLSAELVSAMKLRLDRNEATILFLNRRGYANALLCDDCGHAPECPHCSVALTYHKTASALACHYCGYRQPALTACTTCGSTELRESGTGTQRVEEDVRKALEGTGAVIERMDTDTMKRRGAHRALLERFANNEIDVLIGTQMVAKGLDIPRVTLIGVVHADQGLHQADFRAVERTAQLLVQVSGRAGRDAARPGLVMIQTSTPEHPLYQEQLVADHPYRSETLTAELASRKHLLYPPFGRFIVVECSGPMEADVEHAARVLDRLLPADHPSWVRYGPTTPSIARLRNRYRRIIVIKNNKASDPTGGQCRTLLTSALHMYYATYAVRTVRITVDIDANGTI